jgi:hypothetical protein
LGEVIHRRSILLHAGHPFQPQHRKGLSFPRSSTRYPACASDIQYTSGYTVRAITWKL